MILENDRVVEQNCHMTKSLETRSADEIIAWEPVGLWSRFRPEGPWELSAGFSLGGFTINAISPEGAEEIVI